MLTVITAASSQDLATLAAVKAALGITGTTEDATLAPLITAASAAMAKACNRVLVEETVEESLRSHGTASFTLERYPVTSITTITEDGTVLVDADYEADLAAGIVERLWSDRIGCWARGRTVIRYIGGYSLTTMPGDIVQALVATVASFRSQAARDPLLRAEETTDIERLEWQVGGADGLPASVVALLTDHRKPAGA
jgi:uncharacterized phiE125 gp8 family phage protein